MVSETDDILVEDARVRARVWLQSLALVWLSALSKWFRCEKMKTISKRIAFVRRCGTFVFVLSSAIVHWLSAVISF